MEILYIKPIMTFGIFFQIHTDYHIDDTKAFKNELLRYLYRISDDNAT